MLPPPTPPLTVISNAKKAAAEADLLSQKPGV